MASTIGMPSSGRVCLLASALFLSVFGRPVAGSFGSLSPTSTPHSASPHLVMRTWLSLSAVYQVPSGSEACAGPIELGPMVDSASAASQSADAAVRDSSISSLHFRARGRDHSRGGADCLEDIRASFNVASRQ